MDWEGSVKQGLFQEVAFTGEMKRIVLETVDSPIGLSGLPWKQLAGVAAICLLSVLLITGLPISPNGKMASNLTALDQRAVVFHPLEAEDSTYGMTISVQARDILPGLSNKFNPLLNETNGRIVQIPFSDIDLIAEREVEGFGTILRYTLKPGSATSNDPDIPGNDAPGNPENFGFVLKDAPQSDTLYHYGTGHMFDLQFSMSRLFGQEVLKIQQPVCRTDGEGCVWYLKKDATGQVSALMFLSAEGYERDLDGDGKEESIVVTHKQNQIYIFKEYNGRLSWASVRDILAAGTGDELTYDDASGVFTVLGADAVRTYRYQEGRDRLVQVGVE